MNAAVRPAAASFFVVLAVCSMLAGCSETGPLTIGYVGGLTGRHYNLGISGRNGAELAVDDINARGGIKGRRLKLLIRDDQQDPDMAVKADQELIQAGVPVIIGHMTSAMTKAALPLVNRSRVLMISPTTSSHDFSGQDDHLIMVNPSNRMAADFMAEHLIASRKTHSVAIIYDLSNKAYSEVLANFFRESFQKRGGQVTTTVPFTSGEKISFTGLARKALERSPDALLIVAGSLDTAMFFQQVRKQNKRVQLVTSLWGSTSDLVQHGGAAAEGALFIQPVNVIGAQPEYDAFRKRYEKRYASLPDFAAVFAYESVLVAAAGLEKATEPDGVKAAIIAQGTFPGLQGPFTIDRNGDPQREQFVMTVSNGIISVVE